MDKQGDVDCDSIDTSITSVVPSTLSVLSVLLGPKLSNGREEKGSQIVTRLLSRYTIKLSEELPNHKDLYTYSKIIIPLWTGFRIISIVCGQLFSPLHPFDGLDPHGSVAKDWLVVLAVRAVVLPAVVNLVTQGGLVILVCPSIRQDV